MKFAIPFFLVMLLGTVGVYYGIRPVWKLLGWYHPPVARPAATQNVPPSAPRDPYVRTAALGEIPHPESSATRMAASAVPRKPRLARIPDAVEPAAPDASLNKPETPGANEEASSAAVSAQPPAEAGKPLPGTTIGSKTWGMTITCAAYYSLSGANRGQLPGGSIIDIEDTQTTSRGEMSQGRIERGNDMAGPYLVANADLVRFPVPRSEVPTESIATMKQYYSLKGRLAQRLVELKKQALSANPNPYAVACAEAVQKYKNFGEREKRLVVQRDAASGAERMRLMDTLRAMIPEGKRLEHAVEESTAQYNKWKAANPGVVATDASASDAQVQELRRQIAAIEPQVREIVQ